MNYDYFSKLKILNVIPAESRAFCGRNAGIPCKFTGDSGIHPTQKRCDKTGMTCYILSYQSRIRMNNINLKKTG